PVGSAAARPAEHDPLNANMPGRSIQKRYLRRVVPRRQTPRLPVLKQLMVRADRGLEGLGELRRALESAAALALPLRGGTEFRLRQRQRHIDVAGTTRERPGREPAS